MRSNIHHIYQYDPNFCIAVVRHKLEYMNYLSFYLFAPQLNQNRWSSVYWHCSSKCSEAWDLCEPSFSCKELHRITIYLLGVSMLHHEGCQFLESKVVLSPLTHKLSRNLFCCLAEGESLICKFWRFLQIKQAADVEFIYDTSAKFLNKYKHTLVFQKHDFDSHMLVFLKLIYPFVNLSKASLAQKISLVGFKGILPDCIVALLQIQLI